MARKKTTFEHLLVETDDIKSVFDIYKIDISKKIVEAVSYCIENNQPEVMFMEIELPLEEKILSFLVEEKSFLSYLDTNLPTLVEYEEYELCDKVVKMKERIQQGLPKRRKSKKKKDDDINDLINVIKNL